MSTFKKNEIYNAVKEEIGSELADVFFNYLYTEHHFNPDEVTQFVPGFYDSLSDFLENTEYNEKSLKEFIDNQLISYYSTLNRRY